MATCLTGSRGDVKNYASGFSRTGSALSALPGSAEGRHHPRSGARSDRAGSDAHGPPEVASLRHASGGAPLRQQEPPPLPRRGALLQRRAKLLLLRFAAHRAREQTASRWPPKRMMIVRDDVGQVVGGAGLEPATRGHRIQRPAASTVIAIRHAACGERSRLARLKGERPHLKPNAARSSEPGSNRRPLPYKGSAATC